jgi:hypothetical protein
MFGKSLPFDLLFNSLSSMPRLRIVELHLDGATVGTLMLSAIAAARARVYRRRDDL